MWYKLIIISLSIEEQGLMIGLSVYLYEIGIRKLWWIKFNNMICCLWNFYVKKLKLDLWWNERYKW